MSEDFIKFTAVNNVESDDDEGSSTSNSDSSDSDSCSVASNESYNGDEAKYKNQLKTKNRYFADTEVSSIVCYKCKGIGHIASECPLSENIRKCFMCGKFHEIGKCDQILCFRCNQTGHQAKDCVNAAVSRPASVVSNNVKIDPFLVLCVICGEPGHLNCAETKVKFMNGPSIVFCENCGEEHNISSCDKERFNGFQPRQDNYRNNQSSIQCYACGEQGHISARCPSKSKPKYHAKRRGRERPGRDAPFQGNNRDNYSRHNNHGRNHNNYGQQQNYNNRNNNRNDMFSRPNQNFGNRPRFQNKRKFQHDNQYNNNNRGNNNQYRNNNNPPRKRRR